MTHEPRRLYPPNCASALLAALAIFPLLLTAATARAAETVLAAPALDAGKWSLNLAKNDAGTVVGHRLVLVADDWVLGQKQRTSPLRLTLNCGVATTDVWIENELGARGDEVDVTVAFDEDLVEKRNWGTANNGRYVGLWGLGGPFIERALLHQRLRMTFEMAAGVPAIATFDLRGLDRAIGQLGKSCDWNKGQGDQIDAQR